MMHITNNVVYNLSWPMEFAVLMRIALGQMKEHGRMILVFSAMFACAWLSELFFGNILERLATISVMTGAVMVTVVYALLLWRLVNDWEGSLRRAPQFWFYLGVALYFSACTPLLGSMNYFAALDRSLASKLYWLLQAVCVIHYWMIGKACLVERSALIAQR